MPGLRILLRVCEQGAIAIEKNNLAMCCCGKAEKSSFVTGGRRRSVQGLAVVFRCGFTAGARSFCLPYGAGGRTSHEPFAAGWDLSSAALLTMLSESIMIGTEWMLFFRI
jgi:hypothetical protein